MGTLRVISVYGVVLVSLLCIVSISLAVPVGAQQSDGGIPAGTPATASNPDDPNAAPTTITIASEGCDRVAEGATVTLADGDAAQPTQLRLTDGEEDVEITETGGQIEITGPADEDIYQQGTFLDPNDESFDDTNGESTVVASTGITGCAQTTGTAGTTNTAPDGEGAAPADDEGPDDQQYGDRKADVIVETVPDKPLPKTGGFPLLFGAGLVLLVATSFGSRVIGRR
ncbi:MAG: hypothetical protein M3151_13365 [Actinomycetota bacterium]|nr:hypothetical protein [Actinomycetota bacterium]